MIKRKELTDPASCMSRADDDEPTFVLLARDVSGPMTVRMWVQDRLRQGKNLPGDPQIREAYALADEMEAWRKEHRS